jgi:hypothetical protein
MTDFVFRLDRAKSYEFALVELLNQSGFVTALNGTEHTHPDFANQLRSSEDPTSLFIRFQPDGVACIGNTPRTFYFEVKSSRTIEKMAYDQYMKLASLGNIVVIFFGFKNDNLVEFRWNFIEDIRMRNSYSVLDGYKKVNGENQENIPIIDNWLTPRMLPKESYEQWKQKNKSSGTPYAVVNFSSLLVLSDFKEMIINRLNNSKP